MTTRRFNRHEDDVIDYSRPWRSLDLTVAEWHELVAWAEDLHGSRLSRHEVYVTGCTLLGRCFILKLRVKALWTATGVTDRITRLQQRLHR